MLTGDRLVPTKAAAERLGVDRATLARIVERGELSKVKIGRSARYSLAELDEFVERHTVQTAGR